jgi:membrane-associated phospholipid phosphatase
MQFWLIVTRLGEAEILLPVALLTAMALCLRRDKRPLAVLWMALLLLAVLVTTASKVAFIGWGLGWAAINFTGVSGHSMFASAIYPLLLLTLVASDAQPRRRWALLLGCALAVLVGVSRVAVGAHAWSEVLAGWLVGGAVTAGVLLWTATASVRVLPVVPVLLLAWMSITPVQLQASQSHSLVTRLALKLSGHVQPYTRSDLLRAARQQDS